MVPPIVQQLLVLQERDARCRTIERQVQSVPGELAQAQAEIDQARQRVTEAEETLKRLEVSRKQVDGRRNDTGDQIVKYKTQQMQVKKNEEYTALQHEIDALQARLGGFDDEELALLEQMDAQQAALHVLRLDTTALVNALQQRMSALRESEAAARGELDEARSAYETARSKTPVEALKTYDYVRSQVKRPPYVVPLLELKCGGCHLKVSGEVESQVRRGEPLVRCDNCGRLLFWER